MDTDDSSDRCVDSETGEIRGGDVVRPHRARVPAGLARGGEPPPPTNRGVEFHLDWLSATLWMLPSEAAAMVGRLMKFDGGLDAFEWTGRGGRGFKGILRGPGGVNLYMGPASGDEFCAIEIPGSVMKSVEPEDLRREFGGLECRWQVTRTDPAWDHRLYTPGQVRDAVMDGELRSLAKRRTLREIREPLAGGHTVYLGSRMSERFLRVYLRPEGHTRTELECKGERADLVFRDLLKIRGDSWASRALAHLRDYCDFSAAWWDEFCAGVERARMKLVRWQEESFERVRSWLENQCAASLAMVQEILGRDAVLELAWSGRARLKTRHRVMMAGCKAGPAPASGSGRAGQLPLILNRIEAGAGA